MITASKRPQVHPAVEGRGLEVFTAEALEFIADLHRRFNPTRLDLLRRRGKRQGPGGHGKALAFSEGPRPVGDDLLALAPVPHDLAAPRGVETRRSRRKVVIE